MPAPSYWERIVKGDGCWEWTGPITDKGYGMWTEGGTTRVAHRWSYEAERGPVADGLVLDHLCRNRACVRPDHLEPVTNRENVLRGIGPTAENHRRTVCVNGHPFNEQNTYVEKRGHRQCRTCAVERVRRIRIERRTFTCDICGEERDASSRARHLRWHERAVAS